MDGILEAMSRVDTFQQWSHATSRQRTWWEYLQTEVDALGAASLLSLVLPNFVRVDDCVLIEQLYDPDNYKEWRARVGSDSHAVERAINSVVLWDIFSEEGGAEEELYEQMASRIAAGWRAMAKIQFPHEEFAVEVTSSYGPTVCISRCSNQANQ